jgi:ketosteroid isomerase-like protein
MTTSPQEQFVLDLFKSLDRLEPFFDFLTDDVICVDEISKKWMRGKQAAIETWTPILAAMESCKSTMSDIHIDMAGDLSIVTGMLDQTYVFNGQQATITAPTTFILRKEQGALKACLFHTVPFPEG